MPTATITSKGQVTIPKAVREALGVGPGDRVAFRVKESVAIMEPETVDLRDLFGALTSEVTGVSVEAMERAVAARGRGR